MSKKKHTWKGTPARVMDIEDIKCIIKHFPEKLNIVNEFLEKVNSGLTKEKKDG